MSNESRTMLVVLLVCGLLICGCIVLPVGLGAAFFFMASQRAEMVRAEEAARAQVAVAEARAAQANAQAAQNALQEALPTVPTDPPETSPIAAPGVSSLPRVSEVPTIPPEPPAVSPPTIPLPPLGGLSEAGLSGVLSPEIVAGMLADVEKRKELYKAFKQLRDTEEQIKSLGGVDPTAAALFTGVKQQLLDGLKASGLTQEQIDKIMAEGDKEGW